jgi:hypothetical protein
VVLDFASCPIQSRFIECAEDALAYYHYRLVLTGPHTIKVGPRVAKVRFNPEEIHLFTARDPIEGAELVMRRGARETRYFDRTRARALDRVLETLRNPARALPARTPRAVCVYGPPLSGSPRMCVVVGPEGAGGCWYVRTAYGVSADDFTRTLRSASGKGARWPP